MANFEDNLDACINEAEQKAKLNDSLYNKYVQFVGALEALPRNHFNDDKLSSDIHDIHGRVKPFSQWPTKTSREKSQKVWLNYNQRLQLQQAAKEAGLEGDEEDPSENPNFVAQMLDTCIRTSVRAGLDRQTAFRHCSRQVGKYEHAIRMAMADKGLPKKEMEEFVNDLLKGMANGKQIDMKDMSIEDRQFIQDLKDSLSYKKPDTGIKEDLDDTDEFTQPCHFCDEIFVWSPELTPEDQVNFHVAHVEWLRGPESLSFVDALSKHGFVHVGQGEKGSAYHWAREPVVKESLDDRDAFAKACSYYNCDQREDSEAFHQAHTAAFENAKKSPGYGKFSDAIQREMAKFGYKFVHTGAPVKFGTPFDDRDWILREDIDVDATATFKVGDLELKIGDWIELGPEMKPSAGEGLDDRDEFGSDEDLPTTPVQIMRIVPGGTWAYRNDPKHVADYIADYGVPPMRFAVTLSNSKLLALPDKSGVRWHGRPKHFVPTWYEEWWKKYGDDFLTKLHQDGQLRKIDNIEQWFHAQPEK